MRPELGRWRRDRDAKQRISHKFFAWLSRFRLLMLFDGGIALDRHRM